jgi:hypothetical protein
LQLEKSQKYDERNIRGVEGFRLVQISLCFQAIAGTDAIRRCKTVRLN